MTTLNQSLVDLDKQNDHIGASPYGVVGDSPQRFCKECLVGGAEETCFVCGKRMSTRKPAIWRASETQVQTADVEWDQA